MTAKCRFTTKPLPLHTLYTSTLQGPYMSPTPQQPRPLSTSSDFGQCDNPPCRVRFPEFALLPPSIPARPTKHRGLQEEPLSSRPKTPGCGDSAPAPSLRLLRSEGRPPQLREVRLGLISVEVPALA
ncbi:hypothetical protein M427DRAFT_283609 [Gonapodya prolifera JEL478]|uniref:Uncharacterized protein n=1 Tax=Gonapodya prolifera (strain JEL478) TaxID=1344416 RepID=A0A139AJ58_GONPJ|nr:hypothetical protein M427DRAFT_283609 [Gonapodya prolifera JEL478]|eukprot:KXS16748.1 hypothetical protein M427DRAFT_283609 [Gonapodya prolifera JEL478]